MTKMPLKKNSPAWEKPRDIMKRHLIKRKSSKCLLYSNSSQNGSCSPIPQSPCPVLDGSTQSSEPTNPFKNIVVINWNNNNENRQTAKTSLSQSENGNPFDWDDSTARTSFETVSFMRKSYSQTTTGSFEDKFSQSINDSYPVDFSQLSSLCSSAPDLNTSKEKRSSTEIPKDLRLGTKIRVVSQKPFPWMSNTTTTGSHAITIPEDDIDAAMRISMDNDPSISYASMAPRTPLAVLQAGATYFQFPNICSMPLFPRLDGTYKTSRQTKMIKLQDLGNKCLETLVSEWSQSFDRLYNLWKKNRRHTFYLCSHLFTALFTKIPVRKENLQYTGETSDDTERRLRIVITPTSLGLRQLLREEGIEFSLPLRADTTFVNLTQEDCPKDFLAMKQDVTVDLDHDEWLKEIGISPRTTLKFSRSISAIEDLKSKKRLYSSSQPDDKQNPAVVEPEDSSRSAISIQGIKNIAKFYNLLQNTKVAVSKIGPYAGLPPTLLASAPFYKSVSRELNVSDYMLIFLSLIFEMVSQVTKKDGEVKYILELDNGPILPCVPKTLVEFVKALANPDNKLSVQVNGRSSYSGFNEGVDSQDFASVSEFEVDLLSDTFSW
ncbi:protein downstream neighbor of Son [Ditylenchus destructor]|uniref:Protein downstream neighbor of Son n=1 Tax=Ditylenchus destructor TaxID=166010 RepID=A0AAD4RA48_9BILA|nr:protein downstream neighbor of Son [Ditylenchus destructor]